MSIQATTYLPNSSSVLVQTRQKGSTHVDCFVPLSLTDDEPAEDGERGDDEGHGERIDTGGDGAVTQCGLEVDRSSKIHCTSTS